MSTGKIKQLAFSEGVTVGTPSEIASQAVGFVSYASEAAFVSAEGAATAGDAFYDTTAQVVKYYNGSSWSVIGAGGAATASSLGLVTTYVPTVRSSTYAVSSTNYTILDADGYETILVTTGASQRTITLPAAANNAGRILTIKKVDNGAGTVLIDTPSSETIDGAAQNVLNAQYSFVTIKCDGTNWHVQAANDYLAIESTFTPVTANYVSSSALALSAGEWVIDLNWNAAENAGTSTTAVLIGISTDSTSTTFSDISGSAPVNYSYAPCRDVHGGGAIAGFPVKISASTNYYAKAQTFGANCSGATRFQLRARRVR